MEGHATLKDNKKTQLLSCGNQFLKHTLSSIKLKDTNTAASCSRRYFVSRLRLVDFRRRQNCNSHTQQKLFLCK